MPVSCLSQKGLVTFNCLFSSLQSATHLWLCPLRVGILYQYILALLSLSTLLMDVLSIILQDVTPKCFRFFDLWFFTKVPEELLSIVSKHLVFLALFISFFIVSPDSLCFCLNFRFEGFFCRLQILVCCYFVLFFYFLLLLREIFWVSRFCAMSRSFSISRSALMPSIWSSILVVPFWL